MSIFVLRSIYFHEHFVLRHFVIYIFPQRYHISQSYKTTGTVIAFIGILCLKSLQAPALKHRTPRNNYKRTNSVLCERTVFYVESYKFIVQLMSSAAFLHKSTVSLKSRSCNIPMWPSTTSSTWNSLWLQRLRISC